MAAHDPPPDRLYALAACGVALSPCDRPLTAESFRSALRLLSDLRLELPKDLRDELDLALEQGDVVITECSDGVYIFQVGLPPPFGAIVYGAVDGAAVVQRGTAEAIRFREGVPV